MELRHYPLAQLALTRDNIVPEVSADLSIERMISEEGVRFPILVTPMAATLFDVIDGEKRVAHAKALAERGRLSEAAQRIPCLVVRTCGSVERARWRLIANAHRPLPSDERRLLELEAGYELDGPHPQEQAKELDAETLRVDELVRGLAVRRCAIRGAKKTMRMLEVARDYAAGLLSFQQAMDTYRTSDE